MLGGIVWRLAVEHINFSTTLLGPTASVIPGSKYANDNTNIFLGDDICTQWEIELICGAVVCTTGMYKFSFIKTYSYLLFSQMIRDMPVSNGGGHHIRLGLNGVPNCIGRTHMRGSLMIGCKNYDLARLVH